MAVAAAVALAGLGYGIYNSEKNKQKAKEGLESQKFTNYSISPELQGAYNRAQSMSRFGYSPSEKAAFQQNTSRNINTQAQRALGIGGGNLSRTISRLGQIANLDAQNQFALGDAQLHRQNIKYADSLAQALQSQTNLATGQGINQYNMAEQAFGRAFAQNQTNENQLIGQIPYLVGSFSGGGGARSQPTTQGGFGNPKSINYDYTAPPTDYYNNYQNAYQYSKFG